MKNWKVHSERHSGDSLGLAVAISLVVWSSCVLAHAQEIARPELPEPTPCPALEGIDAEGDVVRFPRVTADCMLARLRLLPELRLYAEALEERVRLDDRRIELRDREIELVSLEAATATEILDAAMRRARDAEENANGWRRHPALWFSLGMVATVLITTVAIWAASTSSD